MGAVADETIAVVAMLLVTGSFPFYLYGAWIMIDAETVTWDVLVYHLKFIVTGLTLAFGDTAGGFRRLVQIVFGLSIAFAASSFFLTFFQFGGGAVV